MQSSPQRRAAWLHKVRMSMQAVDGNLSTMQDLRHEAQAVLEDQSSDKAEKIAKMLILDVKTRWSSTHVMLRRPTNCFCENHIITWLYKYRARNTL